jgi:hypothetical protein
MYSQQCRGAVERQRDEVLAMLTGKFPKAAELMASVLEDVQAFRQFPHQN